MPTNQATADDPRGEGIDGVDFVTLQAAEIVCTVGNNRTKGEHQPGYNGITRLTAPGAPNNAFVPSYAGVNLEHYFDTRPSNAGAVMMEPRYAPMILTRLGDRAVELYQPPTPAWRVESWTRFEVADPCYIDVCFRCRPREPVFAGGIMGVFWASYINAPEDKSVYFLGPDATLDNPRWLQLCTQYHNHFSTVRRAGDTTEIEFQNGSPMLWNQISPLEYGEPFFYGRVGNMVLIYVFADNPCLRFAHSPSGGGDTPDGIDTNPAWDFQLIVPDYQVDAEYALRLRVIYKHWVNRDNVIEEVRRFRALGNGP